jgi:hypothetical protein
MTNEFRKVLDLIKRTNDKLVFYDAVSDSSFVILPLAEYEKLLTQEMKVSGLTEQELLDKINRDIALWRSEQKLEKITESEEEMIEKLNQPKPIEAVPATEDVYQFEPLEE